MSQLIIIENTTPAELFAPGAAEKFLSKIEAFVLDEILDPTTEDGRKDIASLAYKVARTKTAIDDAGKELTEEWRDKTAAVNAERKMIRERLDALKENVRRPLTEYENREKERVAKHEAKLAEINAFEDRIAEADSAELETRLEAVRKIAVNDMEEFSGRGFTRKQEVAFALTQAIYDVKEREAIRAKEEADRKAEEEAARKEREDRIAAEAAEWARLAAEAEAKAEAEAEAARVAEEARRAEEAREAERRAEAERLAAIEREKAEAEERAKEAEERAERERIEAEERAKAAAELAEREKAEAEERRKRELAEAEARAKARAEELENQRLAEEKAKRLADEQRAADVNHREKVIERAALSLVEVGIDPEYAGMAIRSIADGKVPNVTINY